MNIRIRGLFKSGERIDEVVVVPDNIGVGPKVVDHLEKQMREAEFFILANETGILAIDFDELVSFKVTLDNIRPSTTSDEQRASTSLLVEE